MEPKPTVQNKAAQPVMKGSREIRHDLFKLMPAKMVKNNGWKHKQPILTRLEHCHIFHSRNEKTGKINKHTSPTGNHFHEIKVDWNKTERRTFLIDGELVEREQPVVVCGPALTYERANVDGVEIKTITPPKVAVDARLPQFQGLANEGSGENAFHVDQHTHDVMYLETEYFTVGDRDRMRKETYQQVRSVMDGPVSPQAMHVQNLAATAAEGKNIADGKGAPAPEGQK
jgi:hypothetical protein